MDIYARFILSVYAVVILSMVKTTIAVAVDFPLTPSEGIWPGPWIDERLSHDELMDRVSDSVNPMTARRYGNFEAYWKVAGASRTGKFAEAYTARRYYRFIRKANIPYNVCATGLRDVSSPFDLVVINTENGQQYAYQLKLGSEAAMRAVRDGRYSTGFVLTPPDSLSLIKHALHSKKQAALRRGVRLTHFWEEIEDAIQTSRLTDQLPGGWHLTHRSSITLVSKMYYLRLFDLALNSPVTEEAQRQGPSISAKVEFAWTQ